MLGYEELKEILPQNWPFLMLDRVIDYKKDDYLVAIKNISANEWFCDGQSDGGTVFPETLLIEAAAQAALVLYHLSRVKKGERRRYVLGRANAEFSARVSVGDQLHIKAFATKMMDVGGYSNIDIGLNSTIVGKVEVVYSVQK